MHDVKQISIRLFGPLSIRWQDGSIICIRSRKAQCILPLLATSPDGMRTRAWLQGKLWGRVDTEQARGSLRQAILLLRRTFGSSFDEIFEANAVSIGLRPKSWCVVGACDDGDR